jgi:polyisoprenoid-binding protein YceI
MARKMFAACLLAASVATLPAAIAQMPKEAPGKADPARVTAGTYKVDPGHTQVSFSINHLGFSIYHGLFGDPSGTLTLDPAKPNAAKVVVDFPIVGVRTTSAELDEHLKKPEFFDAAKFPTAHFESTSVVASGMNATINGNLTLKGVTKPVTLKAKFIGAGKGPMNSADTVGFEATTTISRSAFGISYGVPLVGDQVDLTIAAAFEKSKA